MVTNNDVIRISKENGFDLIGFAKAEPLKKEYDQYIKWLENGFHAEMGYMEKNQDKRKDVRKIFDEAKSVISLGLNYYTPQSYSGKISNGKISRYAWGKDYHLVMWEKLFLIIQKLKEIDSSFEGISYVDTGPLMDKAWSIRAGIGWQGKHSNVINKEFGSWFFIANIITNQDFEYNEQIEDFCGSCTACLDACPTKAIIEPYVVDATKCISYQTIENKGEISKDLKGKFNNWIFGCDICQDVCPWNIKFSQNSSLTEFYSKEEDSREMNLEWVMNLTEEEFSSLYSNSPIKRTKLKGLKRNAAFLNESI
jgi:epoxyqueuosine reductase